MSEVITKNELKEQIDSTPLLNGNFENHVLLRLSLPRMSSGGRRIRRDFKKKLWWELLLLLETHFSGPGTLPPLVCHRLIGGWWK